MGLAVASTWKGFGSGNVSPSTVACRSCIASSRADCVFGGEEVRGELDTREVEAQHAGQAPRGQGLAQPWEVLDQDVSLGEDGGEHQGQRHPLADDRSLHLV